MLPDPTSDILRNTPDFSSLRKGLMQTGVDVTINDTSTHVGQTLFAPSNKAFEKLGSKLNRFLFSPWGTRYLKALLKYHVVANRTLFSDIYFQAGGQGQLPLKEGSNVSDQWRFDTVHLGLLTADHFRSNSQLWFRDSTSVLPLTFAVPACLSTSMTLSESTEQTLWRWMALFTALTVF
jgi:Fasciclin domain